MYLIYGSSKIEINKKIEELIKKQNIENIIKYDLEESELIDVIEDACYMDMFSDKKCIIAENCYFLTAKDSNDTEELTKYINNPNENTLLIFTLNEEKLDERKKIVKLIKEKFDIYVYNITKDNSNIKTLIINEFKEEDYSITEDALKELLDRTKNNINIVTNEIKKLKLYKINDKKIIKEDVEKVVSKPLEDDVFKLVNAINTKDKKRIFELYQDLLSSRKEVSVIIGLLASQFRLYLSIKILLNEKKSKKEIIEILKEHPYRIEIGIKECYNFKKEDLENYLIELYEIDKNIKTGLTQKENALLMFFLNL